MLARGLILARALHVVDLQGAERMHRMRSPDGRRPGLADAEKAYLALADKLAHRADRVLDRNGTPQRPIFPNRMSGRDRSRPAARPLIHDVGILRIASMDAD